MKSCKSINSALDSAHLAVHRQVRQGPRSLISATMLWNPSSLGVMSLGIQARTALTDELRRRCTVKRRMEFLHRIRSCDETRGKVFRFERSEERRVGKECRWQ